MNDVLGMERKNRYKIKLTPTNQTSAAGLLSNQIEMKKKNRSNFI